MLCGKPDDERTSTIEGLSGHHNRTDALGRQIGKGPLDLLLVAGIEDLDRDRGGLGGLQDSFYFKAAAWIGWIGQIGISLGRGARAASKKGAISY